MPELVRPSERYKDSFLDAVREAQAAGSGLGDTLKWNLDDITADFGKVLRDLTRYEPGNDLPDGLVHSEYRWLVEGEEYLGRVSIRYTLSDSLREFGGHIGYEVRPSARRRGHGTLILRLALERAGMAGQMSELLARYRVTGFNTYGEQISGMHVNQTFVGLALMEPEAGAPDAA